jgi:hypothetical protein
LDHFNGFNVRTIPLRFQFGSENVLRRQSCKILGRPDFALIEQEFDLPFVLGAAEY